MKRLSLLPALLLLTLGIPSHALTVLSDVDDTLKISHVSNAADAAIRVLSKTAFTGMVETLQGIAPVTNHFIYLSARPQALASQTAAFIRDNEFPKGDLVHRQSSDPKDPLHYKAERIREILLSTDANEHFIFIGDDTQADPEAYATVAAEFSHRIDGIFIHQITGRALPSSSMGYLTAYDLANQWSHLGLISSAALKAVTQSILNETRFKRVMPEFQACPRAYEAEDAMMTTLILAHCSERN